MILSKKEVCNLILIESETKMQSFNYAFMEYFFKYGNNNTLFVYFLNFSSSAIIIKMRK